MFKLTFGKFSVARKPIMNGGAIKPGGLLFSSTVPSGSGAFSNADLSVIGGGGVHIRGGGNLSFFGMKLLWDDISSIS